MIPRYQTEKMQTIWSDENKYKTWYTIEIAYLEAFLTHHKKEDKALINRLRSQTNAIDWSAFVENVENYEREVKHDVIAFLHALEDELGEDSRLIHVGLTSSDIVDTSFALLLAKSCDEVLQKLGVLIESLWKKALKSKGLLCLGRTHGQAAEPTTFGIKLLSHLCEFVRARARLMEASSEIRVGKFSGAVGIYAQTEPEIEKAALKALNLSAETIATQVVSRDRHANLFGTLAVLGGSIERLAVEIRLLMHGGVQEVYEPFNAKQKGSSAMPHKRNPIVSENLTGLTRLIRAYAMASFEDQALWHERDISHSSVERVIAPDAFNLMDFALSRLISLIDNLVVDADRMKANLDRKKDVLSSQAVMLALVENGMLRQKAYELVQKASMSSNGKSFKEALFDAGIDEYLRKSELDAVMAKNDVVRHEDFLFNRAKELMAQV